jgi:outer membrane protein
MLKKTEQATNPRQNDSYIQKLTKPLRRDKRQQLMKKLKVLVVAAFLVMAANESMAQVKIAYLSLDQVVGLMPGTAKIDSLLGRYDMDSIQPEYNTLVTNYKFKDSLYRDTVRTPKAVRDEIAKELANYIYQIQNWDQIREQVLQAKQQEYLAPIYKEVMDAVRAVSKEKGYSHVLSRESLIVMPDADNITQAVMTKLKLKAPTAPGRP